METPDSMKDDPVISIGTLAARVGLSVSAVRKYESEGLIIPHRTDTGRRLFSQEDLKRVRYIQHLIQDLGLNIEGIRRMQAVLPCWILSPCEEGTRDRCGAYKENTRPCWTVKIPECAPKGNECRNCLVYRFGSQCTENIKRLVHDLISAKEPGAAVEELLLRKSG
jgi:MerR family transcriptional regulator/heat shock protein HspR